MAKGTKVNNSKAQAGNTTKLTTKQIAKNIKISSPKKANVEVNMVKEPEAVKNKS